MGRSAWKAEGKYQKRRSALGKSAASCSTTFCAGAIPSDPAMATICRESDAKEMQ